MLKILGSYAHLGSLLIRILFFIGVEYCGIRGLKKHLLELEGSALWKYLHLVRSVHMVLSIDLPQ